MADLLSVPEIIALPQCSTGVLSAATAPNRHLPTDRNLVGHGWLALPGVPGLALPGIEMLIPALKNFLPLPRSQDCFEEQGALPGCAALRASSELPAGWPSARSLRLWGELGTAPADGETRNPLIISPALCRCMKLDLAPLAERLLSSSLTPAETTLPLQS